MRRSNTCDRHTEWRTRNVVHTEFCTELNRRWFTSVFTTDTNFEFRFCRTSFANAHFNELTYTFLVKYFKRINFDYAVFLVVFEELRSVVT